MVIIGFWVKNIQTVQLGEVDYGRFAFFTSVSGFLLLFLRFGFFATIKVLLAQNENPKREKQLLAVGVVLAIISGVALALSVFAASFIIDAWFGTTINGLLRAYSPLVVVLPFFFFFSAYGSGSNKILVSAFYNVLPKLFFLIALLVITANHALEVGENIFWQLGSSLMAILIIVFSLRPDFSRFKYYFGIAMIKNRKYGRHYNLGAIANQTTYRLDEFFITYFVDSVHLGFYSLANIICSPMIQLSSAVNSAMFKRFAVLNRIPTKLFLYNTAWLVACVIALGLAADFIVGIILSSEFGEVATYILPLSLVFLIHGSAIPFSFLAAKSRGKDIRNIAWSEAVVNIIGNYVLISQYGVMGAIMASGLAKLFNLALNIFYYRRYLARA